jgi:phosphohistidine swiveling domain-containing protein
MIDVTNMIKTGAWPGITMSESQVLQGATATAALEGKFGIQREFVNLFTDDANVKHTWVPATLMASVADGVDAALAQADSRFVTSLRGYRADATSYRAAVAAVAVSDVEHVPNEVLTERYALLRRLQGAIIVYDQLGILSGEHLTRRVQDLLAGKLSDARERQHAVELCCASWWPSSSLGEEEGIIEIAADICRTEPADALLALPAHERLEAIVEFSRDALARLATEYGAHAAYLHTPPRTIPDYAATVAATLAAYPSVESLQARREQLSRMPRGAECNTQALARALALDDADLRVLEAFREVLAARNESAFELGHATVRLGPIRAELLRRIDVDDVAARVLFDDELVELARGDLDLEDIDIAGRLNFCGYQHTRAKGLMKLSAHDAEAAFAALDGKRHHAHHTQTEAERGICGCAGEAVGPARVVTQMPADRFEPGEILITTSATVDFLPVLKQAAAIVTEHGGIGCHAAIIAREAAVPAVVGYAGATTKFKTGQRLHLDAIAGTVTVIDDEKDAT